jgi:hypothetical protein
VSQPCFTSFSDFSFCQQKGTEKIENAKTAFSSVLFSPVLGSAFRKSRFFAIKKPRLVARGLKSSLCFFNPQAQPLKSIIPAKARGAFPANRTKRMEKKEFCITFCFSFSIIAEIPWKGKLVFSYESPVPKKAISAC